MRDFTYTFGAVCHSHQFKKVQCKFYGMLKWDIQRIILVFNIFWKFLRQHLRISITNFLSHDQKFPCLYRALTRVKEVYDQDSR